MAEKSAFQETYMRAAGAVVFVANVVDGSVLYIPDDPGGHAQSCKKVRVCSGPVVKTQMCIERKNAPEFSRR